MAAEHDLGAVERLKEEVDQLRNELAKERTARCALEARLESKSDELHQTNAELMQLNDFLEKNIKRRTNTLSSLIKNLHSGILLEDENRRILLINQKFCETFNMEYDPDTLIGQDYREVYPFKKELFEDPDAFEHMVSELVEKKELAVNQILKMRDGRVLERDFIPVYSSEEYLGQLWQFRDVTEEYYYEERIRQSEEKYRGIIENMELGLLEVDRDHKIIKAYDSFCEMVGYTKEELIGKDTHELFFPKQYREMMKLQDTKRQTGKQSIYEVQMKRKNGELIWVLISGSPFYDDEGNFSGSIGIHYNITERKKLENDLRESRVVAENARDAEKQFLANMSHEIRNPINAITGIISLLYDTHLTDEQLDYLNNIQYASDILLGLISDILDLSKIEAGKMELNEKSFELGENIRAIIKTYNFKTSDKNIKFSYELDDRLSAPVYADPTVINQILLNLIGNAVKFTDEGEVTICSKVLSEEGGYFLIETAVKDTGIGISKKELTKIFDTFNQGNKQTKLKYGGTGLGLSIVRQLLKIYNGSISVDSEPGKGSVFTFTLRLKKGELVTSEEKDSLPKPAFESGTIKHVLIVEDNRVNQQYLVGLLRKWGITYNIANHGGEAMELIEKNHYDLVLMDIRMPVMDGYETTIRIRNHEKNPNRDIPIIALTASALVDEKERALEAGMNFHLTKPFSPDQLLGTINEISDGNITVEDNESIFKYSEDLDHTYLETFYENDLERAALMFEIFLGNISKEIAELKRYYVKEDWEKFGALAHRIKPNFAMVGLTPFTDLMKEFERLGKNGEGSELREIVPVFFQEYKNKLKLVKKELSRMTAILDN